MVEAGLSPRNLKERLGVVGMDARRMNALVVTHGHTDHVQSAPEIAESLRIPTLATTSCASARARAGRPLWGHQALAVGQVIPFGSLSIRAFPTPHDAPGSVGLVIDDGHSRLALVTDLGCITTDVVRAIDDVQLLYIEFNHDLQMLMEGPYPRVLKNRVKSNMGHLSNAQGAQLLAQVRGPLLRHVVLAHLSEQNNTPALAMQEARRVLDGSGIGVHVAVQQQSLPPIIVGGGKRHPASAVRSEPPSPSAPPERSTPLPVPTPDREGAKLGAGARAQLNLFAPPTSQRSGS